MCIVKAMLETKIIPDFFVVEGTEGGTGAAPLEFANHVGMPMIEGLTFVHNTLRGMGVRSQIELGAAGNNVSAFDIARTLALGADWCNSARGYMFVIGCIQAQACHTNRCTVGVATQDPIRQRALDPIGKSKRVASVHRNTLAALGEMTGAAGLSSPREFLPRHLMIRQADAQMVTGDDAFASLEIGSLLKEGKDDSGGYLARWSRANAKQFEPSD